MKVAAARTVPGLARASICFVAMPGTSAMSQSRQILRQTQGRCGPQFGNLSAALEGFVGGSGSHAFYFLDPDGNRIEVYCWMMTVTGSSIAAPHADL